jgi:hypothetical protein
LASSVHFLVGDTFQVGLSRGLFITNKPCLI